MDAARTASFHICIGKLARDDVIAHPESTLSNCREQRWTKDAYYTYYQATCDAKGSTATVEGRFAGDFKYNFQGELSTTFSPPLDGVTVIHRHGRVVPGEGAPGAVLDGFTIACGQGAVEIIEAQREGKRPMPAAEVLRGLTLTRLS